LSHQTTALSKTETLGIGELAKCAGVTTRTVRYYEEVGILRGVSRTPRGRRRYSHRHLYALRLIRRAKLLGLSLAEIRELAEIGWTDMNETRVTQRAIEILKAHLTRVEERLAEMERFRALLVKEIARLQQLLERQTAHVGD